MRLRVSGVCLLLSVCGIAQQTSPVATSNTMQVTVPHLVRISGQIQAASRTVGVTFALYKSQTDTAPLWMETQNVALDANGKYTALIGATTREGIPLELFASGEAQWLGIRQEGKPEQPRILLVSVPYAMKAAEAETLAGHSANEFVTQQNLGEMVTLKLQEPEIRTVLANPFASPTTPVTDGATNFTDSTTNQIVLVTQNGTGKLIAGEGPSHMVVFSVDQTGVVHGSGLTLDASASRSIAMGNNPVSGGSGSGLVIEAGLPAYGTANKRGGELVLSAGTGTGNGGSGDVIIRTAPPQASGTGGDTLVTRVVYASSPVDMGGAAGEVSLANVKLPPNSSALLRIHFRIHATDGSAHTAMASGDCSLLMTTDSGGLFSVGTKFGADYAENSYTSDSVNAGCVPAEALTVYDSLSFTPTVHTITYELENLSDLPLVLKYNTSSAEEGRLPVVSGNARAMQRPAFAGGERKTEEFAGQQNLKEVVQLKPREPEIRTVLANPFVTGTTPVTDGATNFTDSTSDQILLVTQNSTGKLIVGEGPSHTPVFSVGQAGDIHGTALTLDSSASRAIGMSNNPVSGGAGNALVVTAGAPYSGTANKRGGELILAAGTGTGTGGSGDVMIRTAPPGASGSAGDTPIARQLYASSPVNMGGSSGEATLAGLQVPASGFGAMEIHFNISASDGSAHFAGATGTCIVVANRDNLGLMTLTAKRAADYWEVSRSTDKVSAGCVPGGASAAELGVYDNLSFTPTVHTITYQIVNNSEWPVVLYYNTSSAEKMPSPVMPAEARTTREHPSVTLRQQANGEFVVEKE